MSRVEIDTSGLAKLEDDLLAAAADTARRIEPIVKRGAQNVKTDWAAAWTGIRGMPAIARAVSYDVTVEAAAVEAEVGPDKDRTQGALGNIVEFGGSKHPPLRPAGEQVLKAEEPRFVQAIEDVGFEVLR